MDGRADSIAALGPSITDSAPAKKPKAKKLVTRKTKRMLKAVKAIAKKKKKAAVKRPKVKAKRKPAAKKAKPGGVVRSQRIDIRLSKAEKAKLTARAKKLRRTITSVLQEMIEKLK